MGDEEKESNAPYAKGTEQSLEYNRRTLKWAGFLLSRSATRNEYFKENLTLPGCTTTTTTTISITTTTTATLFLAKNREDDVVDST